MTQTISTIASRIRAFIDACSSAETGRVPAQFESQFGTLALELFALQHAHNAPYRRWCDARGVAPGCIRHWSEIPAVPASAFKEWDLTSLPPAERTTVFHSSGTTESRPGRHFHDAESLALYEASVLPWFKTHLLADARDESRPPRFISLTPPPALVPRSSLACMFGNVARKFGSADSCFLGSVEPSGAWTLARAHAIEVLRDAAASNQPVVVAGTAFNFVQLLDPPSADFANVQLPPGSRALETGGYKGRTRVLPRDDLHVLIASRMGIAPDCIVCEYGMSELGSQAYDRVASGARHPFQFPPWARARVVSPEDGGEVRDGETGLIRVFDLANVRSVLAVQTEDLGVRRGDGFELLGRAGSAEPRGCSLMTAEISSR